MPDITMCIGNECLIKNYCFRFTAKPSGWQSFADFRCKEDGKCDHFLQDRRAAAPVHKSSFDYEAEYREVINKQQP
jgi:hypothetical protein